MRTISDFVNLFPVSKTLKWALKPIGKTEHFINENRIIENDRNKAVIYNKAKSILDEVYRDFINSSLGCIEKDGINYSVTDYDELAVALDIFQKDKVANRDSLYKAMSNCRTKIVNHIKIMENFKSFAGSGKAKEVLSLAYEKDETGELKSVFDRFSSYFIGYCQNRANLFSPEAKASSLAYRVIDENFPKFHRNTKTLVRIKSDYTDLYFEIKKTVMKEYGVVDIDLFFSNERYCDYMIQSGIERYNLILGGKTLEDGTKSQGINELVNLYCQKNKDVKRRDILFVPLFKQLMEERTRESFIPRQCESDKELIEVVETTFDYIESVHKMLSIIAEYKTFDVEHVYISKKLIPSLSIDVFGPGKWETFFDCMIEEKRKAIIRKTGKDVLTKTQIKDLETVCKQEFYSLSYLESIFELNRDKVLKSDDNTKGKNLSDIISNKAKLLSNSLSTSFQAYRTQPYLGKIRKDAAYIVTLKAYLDSLINAGRFIKGFLPSSDYENDSVFYEEFESYDDKYRNIVRIYDFARNYSTKEISAEEKFKLNFNCPTLANGWDRNKEHDNLCVILRKNGKYYLAIRNKMDESSVLINGDNCKPKAGDSVYEKMIYKLLSDPVKDLPHAFFTDKGKQSPYGPSDVLVKAYKRNKDKEPLYYEGMFKSEREYEVALIKYYIGAIPQHRDWFEFHMKFKDPEQYENLKEFYEDVKRQSYFISFESVSETTVNEMVNAGKIFLFQIYNKDFAGGSTGRKNLHTMYWEYLFSKENLNCHRTIKLNGKAELFYRPAITGPKDITHPIGSYLVNRNTSDGICIPNKYHKEIYEFVNGRQETLSKEAFAWYGRAVIKKSDRNLVKGNRFTKDQFSFHVPITINYNASNNANINEETCRMLVSNPDCNIIGIDRGERNLLYVSVINQKGELLYQKSLNYVPGSNNTDVDYYSKLEDAEETREEARSSWGTIGKIANLKEGYLSSVITFITDLMVKYNAIVVLENLNVGFKRGRFKVEKQVYQKFEAALINKLGLIVSKSAKPGEARSIPLALQLSEKFESFEKIGTQTGWLFYVPAAFTSKIDPTTGFANLFNLKDLTNFDKKLDFFSRFKSIRYDINDKDFKFTFSYSDFSCVVKQAKSKTWELSSRGERILHEKDGSYYKERPTEKLASLLSSTDLEYKGGKDIVPWLMNLQRSNVNITLIDEFYRVFVHILQMRNSCSSTDEDYILSPVKGNLGYYDSRDYDTNSKLPCDADANGAYNIARKGIVMINKMRSNPDVFRNATKISNEEWFEYTVQ